MLEEALSIGGGGGGGGGCPNANRALADRVNSVNYVRLIADPPLTTISTPSRSFSMLANLPLASARYGHRGTDAYPISTMLA